MKFNLDLLKFHAFHLDKKHTNRIDNKYDWDVFWEKLGKKIHHMIQFSSINCKTGKKDHILDENAFNTLFKIISQCHPNLKRELLQYMENIDIENKKVHEYFFQFHLDAHSREVVFAFRYYWNGKEMIAPLILDLNHCIYKVNKDKPYHYKYLKSWVNWDWKEGQQALKGCINKSLGQK